MDEPFCVQSGRGVQIPKINCVSTLWMAPKHSNTNNLPCPQSQHECKFTVNCKDFISGLRDAVIHDRFISIKKESKVLKNWVISKSSI